MTAARFDRVVIEDGHLWTSPFCRWQGALSETSSLDLAAAVTRRALQERAVDPQTLGQLVLGTTIPQQGAFYGAPTLAGRIGAPQTTGPMIAQACATSVACLAAAAATLESGGDAPVLVVTADRTSNGPVLVHPRPHAQGGSPHLETWVLDNFARDPWAGGAMIETAEAVARLSGMTRIELDEATLLRYSQYHSAHAGTNPVVARCIVAAEAGRGRDQVTVTEDQGVHRPCAADLAGLDPVVEGGVVTFGSQTHPADGAAGALLSARPARSGGPSTRLLSVGYARVGRGLMPQAPVPAAARALAAAGLSIQDVHLVTTHNPFIVSDLWFARQTGFPLDRMNVLGSSLVYGHPQAPTGLRAIAELVEALRERGGGVGLFSGCAAGDTAGAMVVRVE